MFISVPVKSKMQEKFSRHAVKKRGAATLAVFPVLLFICCLIQEKTEMQRSKMLPPMAPLGDGTVPFNRKMEGLATATAAVVLGWGLGRWVLVSGGMREPRRLGGADTSAEGTAPCCGAERWRSRGQARRPRRAGGGRVGRTEQKGQRVPLESAPSAGRRVGKAETRRGRLRAGRPSANSPDSCIQETTTKKVRLHNFQ